MIDRFAQLPSSLAEKTRFLRLGPTGVPALLAHPDWETPAPTVIWMHGRTVSKELDSGRYLRWVRAGIAACAIDLPGHGERLDPGYHLPTRTLDLLSEAIPEVDSIVEALADPDLGSVFDLDRLGIGGMSAGGMVALRRLCDPHPFACAAVEGSTGWLAGLYDPEAGGPRSWPVRHPRERVRELDAGEHLGGFRPIPLLVLHSEADRVVPFQIQRAFVERLRERYASAGADPSLVRLHTWPSTGAPEEHAGFGRFGNDAKNLQTAFFAEHLRPEATPD